MFEIIVAIIVVICIIYIFKGDFTKRNVGVTVLESLPLSIFKKWVKEEKSIKEEVSIELNDVKVKNDKNSNDRNSEILEEIAIDILNEEVEEVKYIDETDNIEKISSVESVEDINNIEEKIIDEFNNSYKGISDNLINDAKENIENKDVIEVINEDGEEVKEGEIVYWTPKGKTYHVSNTCRTLTRSKVINSGTIYESGKDFKCEHCK